MADVPWQTPSRLTRPLCNDFARASKLEWLHTNYTGAFAMGTAAGINTRRYHGLLIASLHPPSNRYSVFPRVEETVNTDAGSFELAAVQYPGIVSPSGFELLEAFSWVPFPAWTYRCGPITLEKTVRLLEGEQSVVISYRADSSCALAVRLFLSFRDYHSVAKQNPALRQDVMQGDQVLELQPYPDLPTLRIHHSGSFQADPKWYLNNEYLEELDRGLDFAEDLYSPGVLHFQLEANKTLDLVATLEEGERDTRDRSPRFDDPFARALDQFRAIRSDQKPTLMAGFPWFTDWSRDTLISLPAYIHFGFDKDAAKLTLDLLLNERRQGILPNRFADRQSTPEYNTVDASLWFFNAASEYMKATGDNPFLRDALYPAALDIIDWYRRGTFYNIHVDPTDHLLAAGEAGTQLTWMDAKIGDYTVTPRAGKPVEINALWFNALRTTSDWANQLGDFAASARLSEEAGLVEESFTTKFWNEGRQCLYDVVTLTGVDASFRPNQIFAASLAYPLLDRDRAKLVVAAVQQFLLTPVGLRTLEQADPQYRPRFEGDMRSRDSAYHQGTVWPWLIGPFVNAYLYAHGEDSLAKSECMKLVRPMFDLMSGGCLGSIAEVFDGDEPRRPGGCPAQLWSVAQVALAMRRLNS